MPGVTVLPYGDERVSMTTYDPIRIDPLVKGDLALQNIIRADKELFMQALGARIQNGSSALIMAVKQQGGSTCTEAPSFAGLLSNRSLYNQEFQEINEKMPFLPDGEVLRLQTQLEQDSRNFEAESISYTQTIMRNRQDTELDDLTRMVSRKSKWKHLFSHLKKPKVDKGAGSTSSDNRQKDGIFYPAKT